MKIAPALLRIALAFFAPITPAAMVVLTPTVAEASNIDQVVEEISHLIIQGKIREATIALSAFYWEGGNMATLVGLIERRLEKEKQATQLLRFLNNAISYLPAKMLSVTPFVIIIDDKEVKRALSPAAGEHVPDET